MKSCLALGEDNSQANFLLAHLYMQKEKYAEAHECYQKVSTAVNVLEFESFASSHNICSFQVKDPDHTALFNHAIALVKLGKHGKALTQAHKALDKKPGFADAEKLIKSIEYTTDAKPEDDEAPELPKVHNGQ